MNVWIRTTISQSFNIIAILLLLLSSIWSLGWASSLPSDVKVMMDYWAPYYSPALAIVPNGVLIRIVNPTSSPHTLTHVGCRTSGSCAFDTGALHSGQDFTIHSLLPGRYAYYCVLHPIMKGEIIVLPKNPMLNPTASHDHRTNTHLRGIQ